MTVISGVLTAPDGSALPSVSINLKALATSSAVVAQLESETVTDASGNYSISAEVGQYQVTISAYGQPDKLVGNIQIFADSVNGTLNDFLTTPGEDALTPVIVATVESMRLAAQTAATDALAARDAAQGYAIHAEAVSEGGATYASTTAGLAATTSGQYFRVPQGTGATSSFIYYLNNAGSALAVADAVGKAAVDAVAAIIPVVQSAPGIVHAFADENGNTALAILSNGLAKVASMMFG
ncbi:prophage tail fiber N-terminal domain-containing protein, partial [Sodalis sp. dw_96]|uniref:prophage tail fiber N-terminal domain-containing protein n=1 Tax=Sodalis sp. dw_96 TaxID=2719794 RepID=UPI001BD2E5EF